ncbi:RGS domain-containing protein [Aspergillus avenaceus]|uniref:RGS domain-containing protein n=1 Tax=Aspergillus avenaceus TaxID=36643 RepID=A0A5N6U393_ASPAV|nr:RGS domain-containing protein [Aspergillus avenaceus]
MRPQAKQFYHLRPKLDEILNDTAPVPYTLGAFVAFLSQNHCLEVLEFILEARRYRKTYDWLEQNDNKDEEQQLRLRRQWDRILETYIETGSSHEINVPDDTRQELLDHGQKSEHIPPPNGLDKAVHHMHELLRESILIPFLRNCSGTSHVQPLSVPCLSGTEPVSPDLRATDDCARQRMKSMRLISSSPADMESSDVSEPSTRPISRATDTPDVYRSSSDEARVISGGHDWDVIPDDTGTKIEHARTTPEAEVPPPVARKKKWRRLQSFAKHFRRTSD